MAPSSVCIETSVPSAYVTTRTDPASLFRREKTREWWREHSSLYDLCVSEGVVLELQKGAWQGQEEALALVHPLRSLFVDAEVLAVARRYIAERLIPQDIGGDALHLAAASVHRIDFLLTWNIRHLANPNKLLHLTVINGGWDCLRLTS